MHSVQNDIACYHCGTNCSVKSPEMDGHRFCCQGCLSVYEIVSQSGACDYYTITPHSGTRPRLDNTERFVVLDNELERSRVVEYEDEQSIRASFKIPDMHCAGCVWILERLNKFDPGIISSRVNLLNHRVSIECDKRITKLSNVARLLTSLGYEPDLTESLDTGSHTINRSRRDLYTRIGVAGFGAGNVMMIGLANYIAGPGGLDPVIKAVFDLLSVAISIPVLLYSAQPWLSSALQSIRHGIVNLDVPVSLGILTIFTRSCVDVLTGSSEGFLDSFNGLVFFLLIGRMFQQRAFATIDFERSVRSFFPISASRIVGDHEETVHIDMVAERDVVRVRNGEVVPADAILLYEPGVVDYSFVTGESTPVECKPGTMLYAGGRVLGRSVTCAVVKPASSSYMASLWSRADVHTNRDELARQSDRFGLAFTIVTLAIACIAAAFWLPKMSMAANVFTSVLIIACPCALTLSAPISYGSAMGLLSRVGIFLRNTSIVAQLQRVGHIVFDKTGTLTTPTCLAYYGSDLTPEQHTCVMALAAQSSHPISKALVESQQQGLPCVDDFEEEPGSGIYGTCLGHRVGLQGMPSANQQDGVGSRTFISFDGEILGYYAVEHQLRPGMADMMLMLRKQYDVSLVTGDSGSISSEICNLFATKNINQGAKPLDKVFYVQSLQRNDNNVMMVGDGVNDLAALSTANVSLALSNGSARIVPSCDIAMDAQRVAQLPNLLKYARMTRRVVNAAFWFTMVYNVLGMTLSVQGYLSPVVTAVMMPSSSLIVIAISIIGTRYCFRSLQWV